MGMTTQLLYSGSDFMKELGWLTTIIVSLAGVLMGLYAVYIGFLFATASDANKRKAARERLIKVMASAFIIIALAALLGAININFSKIKTDDNNESVEDRYSSGNLKGWNYSENVEMNMTLSMQGNFTYTKGSFEISLENVTKDGEKIDANKYEFEGCQVTTKNFSGNNLETSGEHMEFKNDNRTLKYSYNGLKTNFQCESFSDGKYYITIRVTIQDKQDSQFYYLNMLVYITGSV